MSADIQIRKSGTPVTWKRPAWTHSRPADSAYPGDGPALLEMMESCRNVLEQIAKSQMLQCEVANNIRRIRIAIEKLDKRLAKTRKLR